MSDWTWDYVPNAASVVGGLIFNRALAGRGVYDIARLYWDLHAGREPADHLISA